MPWLHNQVAGFVDTITKLTSVAWKLFSSTCWLYKGHCMKNSEPVWSRWSPLDHRHFDKCCGAETFATLIGISEKKFGFNTICYCSSNCILFSFLHKSSCFVEHQAVYLTIYIILLSVYNHLIVLQLNKYQSDTKNKCWAVCILARATGLFLTPLPNV